LSISQLHVLNNICNTHTSYSSSGFDILDVFSGRPSGGCAISWRVDIQAQVFFVRIVNKFAQFDGTHKILLINTYAVESDDALEDEFSLALADVSAIIDQFADHCLVFGGDFKVDFNQHKSHTRLLRNICNENDLLVVTLHDCCIVFTSHIILI